MNDEDKKNEPPILRWVATAGGVVAGAITITQQLNISAEQALPYALMLVCLIGMLYMLNRDRKMDAKKIAALETALAEDRERFARERVEAERKIQILNDNIRKMYRDMLESGGRRRVGNFSQHPEFGIDVYHEVPRAVGTPADRGGK